MDGTLTDGTLTAGGADERRYHVHDGLGLMGLKRSGVEVCFLTGRVTAELIGRVRQLEIPESAIYAGAFNKLEVFDRILEERKAERESTAYMGDDYPDLPVLRRVGHPIVPVNAPRDLINVARFVPARLPGHGAVRDACDYILRQNGMVDFMEKEFGGGK